MFSHACAGKSTAKEGYSGYLIEECVENRLRAKGCASQNISGTRDVGLPGGSSASLEEQDDTGKLASWRSSGQLTSREGRPSVPERCQEDEACDRVAHWHSTTHRYPVLMWLIEWVGGAHNRFKDGRDDGKTPRREQGGSRRIR